MLVCYDVSTETAEGKRRLRRVAKACLDFGIRVQNSVFECNVDPAQWVRLKTNLENICDPDCDSLRYYHLGDNYHRKIEHYGAKPTIDVEEPLLL